MAVLGAVATFVLVGSASAFEAIDYFGDIRDIFRYCMKVLGTGFLAFGLFGAFVYFALYLAIRAGQFTLGGGKPNEIVLVLIAAAAAQLGRIEVKSPPVVEGLLVGRDRESYYAKGIRMFRRNLYRRIIEQTPEGAQLNSMLMRALPAVYNSQQVTREFEVWAHDKNLEQWRRDVFTSQKVTAEQKRIIQLFKIVKDDVRHAKYLACSRATDVISKKAF